MTQDEFETLLRQFCTDVEEALQNRPPWFNPGEAICDNVWAWCAYHHHDGLAFISSLKRLFRADYADSLFPFNPVAGTFSDECEDGTLYLNPERLAFIRKWSTIA